MPIIDFDIKGARQAGATDADIAEYFKKTHSIDFDIEGAVKSGATDEDILGYINQKYSEGLPKKKAMLSDVGQPFVSPVSNGAQMVSPSPLKSNVKSVEQKTNKVKAYNPFTATVDEIQKNVDDQRIGKVTQQQLDDNPRYQYLLNKKEAYDRGYTDDKTLNGKTAEQKLFDDRESYLVQNYLSPKEQEEVNSLANYKSYVKQGKQKEADVELQKYLNAKSDFRKEIDDQIVQIEATLPNIKDPDELLLARRTVEELKLQKKPIYDPEMAMNDLLEENESDVSQMTKPTETAKEKLRKYTNSLYGSVLKQRERLGLVEDMNGSERLVAEYKILSNYEGAEYTQKKAELDKLHNDELKLRNATKIYELNRTPFEKDTAIGVFAKSYMGELLPYKKGKEGVDNVIANNIQSIVNDADIVKAADKEQVALAKQYDKPYQFGSTKWVAQTLAPTAAIMTEMIPATIATEGLASITGLGRLNRAVSILAERGSLGKAGSMYFGALQANKYGRGLLKAAASGVKYGIESEAATILAPQIKDEMGFANGLFAGAAGSAIGQLSGKVLETSLRSVASLFGNKSTEAIKAIESYGAMIAKAKDFSNKVVGETAEEYVEQLTSIYKQSEGYNAFIENVRKHYETTDALEEFATIFMMSLGAPAGSSLATGLFNGSKKAYNNLNREERKVADQMADELHDEQKDVMESVINKVAEEKGIDLDKEIKKQDAVEDNFTSKTPVKETVDEQKAENKPEEKPVKEQKAEKIVNEKAVSEVEASKPVEPIKEPTTTTPPSSSVSSEVSAPSVVENKIGDIERRRQEELKSRVVYDRFPTVEDGEFKIIGDPNNRTYRINENTGRPQELDESNGLWSNTALSPNLFMESTKRSGFEKSKDKINAKYDAELKEIEAQKPSVVEDSAEADTYYHISAPANRESILSKGLIPQVGDYSLGINETDKVSVSKAKAKEELFEGSYDDDVYEVVYPSDKLKKDERLIEVGNHYYTTEPIDKANIRLVRKGTGKLVDEMTDAEYEARNKSLDEIFSNAEKTTKTLSTTTSIKENDTTRVLPSDKGTQTSSEPTKQTENVSGTEVKETPVPQEVEVAETAKVFDEILATEENTKSETIKESKYKKAIEKAPNPKEVKRVVENIDYIRKTLLEKGRIKSIDCKWG